LNTWCIEEKRFSQMNIVRMQQNHPEQNFIVCELSPSSCIMKQLLVNVLSC